MIWEIWGIDLPVIEITAGSFDEALEIARRINKKYDTGRIKKLH